MKRDRVNAGYRIIESMHAGTTEFVLGHNPKAVQPYVTWATNGPSDYFWGHYFDTLREAQRDLAKRVLTALP